MTKLAILAAFVLALPACSTSVSMAAPDVPAALAVPTGNTLALELHASGVQIYVCQPKKDDPTTFEWAFSAPDAQLTDLSGKAAGHHEKGPIWVSTDGSKVTGKLEQKADAPGANDIPWLLLSAKSVEGSGAFGKVTYIQRLATQGGKAPKDGADAAHAGQEQRVEYKANYYFYVAGK